MGSIFSNANTIKIWLNGIGMGQYLQLFIDEGFGDELPQSEALQCLTDQQLKEMGIKKLAHRNLILSNVNKMGHDLEKGMDAKLSLNEGLANNVVTIGDAHSDLDFESDEELDDAEFRKITSGKNDTFGGNEDMY